VTWLKPHSQVTADGPGSGSCHAVPSSARFLIESENIVGDV